MTPAHQCVQDEIRDEVISPVRAWESWGCSAW